MTSLANYDIIRDMKRIGNKLTTNPGRERTAIAFRLSPPLADWCMAAAQKSGRSRNDFMESVLHAIRTIVKDSEDWQRDGLDPASAMDVIGPACVEEIVRLGLGNAFMAEALEHYTTRERQTLIEVRKDKAKREGGEEDE